MIINHRNYLGRLDAYTVAEFIDLRLNEHNYEGGELEQLRRLVGRQTELLAKLAQLVVKNREDLAALVYIADYETEVIE